ncbi:MAG TPA: hypothetical protein DIC64_04220 [Alphaproteobacteria bacterium]|nr:hypothetical protein [Alphaproteobacteria bacterium]
MGIYMPTPNYTLKEKIEQSFSFAYDKINKKKFLEEQKKFISSIDSETYKCTDQELANNIKTFDMCDIIARDSEIIGRAIQVEMKKNGGRLTAGVYSKVKRNFFRFGYETKYIKDGHEYVDYVPDTYCHAGDRAICKYLIATWKHGEELGHAIGLNDEQILTIKTAVKDTYMPQENGHQTRTNGREM